MAAKVIGIVQRKGGVGKTTETLNLAFEAALDGKRTLVIDADPQGSLAVGWSEDRENPDPLPNGMSIISMCTTKIHRDIRAISEGFDLVIIDGPPRATGITRSIMLASDMVIIPCTPSGLDVKAAKKTLIAAYDAREYLGDLKILFSINRKTANTTLGQGLRESLLELSDDVVALNAEVCMRIAFAEAMSDGVSIQELDSGSKARLEIKDLYTEIMGILYEKSED